jgi:hypothetical protein
MRSLLTCLVFMIATPAFADMTAVYETPAKNFRMTVEIAANGDLRGDVVGKPGTYSLTRGGKGYVVIATPNGVVVDSLDDLSAALKMVMKKRLNPSMLALMESVGPDLADARLTLTKGDDIIVQGRKGTPYYFPGPRSPGVPPVMVISSDPELMPLSAAMAHQMVLSDSLQPTGLNNPFALDVETVMKTGAPVVFGGAELTTVSHDAIPAARFELPSSPERLEDVVKRIDATATDQRVTAF